MNHVIEFESDHFIKKGYCTLILIDIEVCNLAKSTGELDLFYTIGSMFNIDLECAHTLEDFPRDEQKKIRELAEKSINEADYMSYVKGMHE